MEKVKSKIIYQKHYQHAKMNLLKSNFIDRKFWRERVIFLYKLMKKMGEEPKNL